MKRLVIISGANGTGKTTLAKEFLKKYKIEFLNADEIAINLSKDKKNLLENRIKARVDAGGHDVPKEDVLRRFERSKINFWKIYKIIADEWTMFYNGMGRPVLVASGEKSGFEILDDQLFELFRKTK